MMINILRYRLLNDPWWMEIKQNMDKCKWNAFFPCLSRIFSRMSWNLSRWWKLEKSLTRQLWLCSRHRFYIPIFHLFCINWSLGKIECRIFPGKTQKWWWENIRWIWEGVGGMKRQKASGDQALEIKIDKIQNDSSLSSFTLVGRTEISLKKFSSKEPPKPLN